MASGFIYAAQCSIDWTVAQGGALRSERMMKYVTQEGGGGEWFNMANFCTALWSTYQQAMAKIV